MSTHKRLSQLSFSAIALLVVAIPALAQTESVQNEIAKADVSKQVAAIAIVRADNFFAVEKPSSSSIAAPAITEKRPSLVAAQFSEAVSQPALTSDVAGIFSKPEKTFDKTSPKDLSFIASRGPKVPW